MLCAALFVALPAVAQDQAPTTTTSAAGTGQDPKPGVIGSDTSPEDFDLARKKVEDCEGEKFQFSWGAGSRPTKVTLCSKKDATPDELVRMLEDAAAKLEGTISIAEDRRIAIVQQIRAKIAELKFAAAAASERRAVAEPAAGLPQASLAAPTQPTAQAPYAAAPVFTPNPSPVAARPLPAAKPRLTFECYSPGDIGSGGPCTSISDDTRLTVKAAAPVAGGTGLRFRRHGETRAEIALNPMRRGQSVRIVVPQTLCAGVVKAEVEIQVTQGGNPVDTRGPFLLRC